MYMAPEIVKKQIYDYVLRFFLVILIYQKGVDIWSIGIIMYILFRNQQHPIYQNKERKKAYFKRLKRLKQEELPNLPSGYFLKLFQKINHYQSMQTEFFHQLAAVNIMDRFTAVEAL